MKKEQITATQAAELKQNSKGSDDLLNAEIEAAASAGLSWIDVRRPVSAEEVESLKKRKFLVIEYPILVEHNPADPALYLRVKW